MKISKELIEKLSKLSKLSLSDQKKEEFTSQLTNIFNFFESLKEVDTSSVEYTSLNKENTLREDAVEERKNQKDILANTPKVKNGYVEVKSVLGKVT